MVPVVFGVCRQRVRWFSGFCRLPGEGNWCLCSGGWGWILSFQWGGPLLVVFWGVCELSMILGSLSANGWGCVPVLLVVWHGASSTGACWPLGGAGS